MSSSPSLPLSPSDINLCIWAADQRADSKIETSRLQRRCKVADQQNPTARTARNFGYARRFRQCREYEDQVLYGCEQSNYSKEVRLHLTFH